MGPSPLRRQLSSLWGAALAVALATTFLSTLLLGMGQVGRSLNNVMTAGLGEAAVVVEPAHPIPDLSVITTQPGVSAAHRVHTIWCALSKPGEQPPAQVRQDELVETLASVELQANAPVPELETVAIQHGHSPLPGEIGLTAVTAAELDLELGEPVSLHLQDLSGQTRYLNLTYRTTLAPPSSFATNQIPALVNPQDFAHIEQFTSEDVSISQWATILVAVSGSHPENVAQGLRERLGADTVVYTAQSWAENRLLAYTGTDRFTDALTLSFAALGVAVAGLVVATTFHVLITRRTWELAIQRCMGATRRQLRNQVLRQALLLGGTASAIGVTAGHLIGQLAAMVAQGHERIRLSAPGLLVTPTSVLVPLLAGIAITVGAALPAARRASRTSPLAAMRTQSQETSSSKTLLFGGALVAAGVSMLLIVAQAANSYLNLGSEGFVTLSLMGIGGAVPLMAGLIIASHPALVWAIRAAKPLLEHAGGSRLRASTRIALLSITRSSARAGTTIGAVVVGVSLAVSVATGARTAHSSLTYLFTASNPFDIEAYHVDAVDDADLAAIANLPGVEAVAATHEAPIALRLTHGEQVGYGTLSVGRSEQIAQVSSDAYLALPLPGELLLSVDHAETLGLSDGEAIMVAPLAAPPGEPKIVDGVLVSPADLYFPVSGPSFYLTALEYVADQLGPGDGGHAGAGQSDGDQYGGGQYGAGQSDATAPLLEESVLEAGAEAGLEVGVEAGTEAGLEVLAAEAAASEAQLASLNREIAAMLQATRAHILSLDWGRAPTLVVRTVYYTPVINVDVDSLHTQERFSLDAAPVPATLGAGESTSLPTLTNQRTPLQNSRILVQVDQDRAQDLLPQVGPKIAERTNGQMPQIEGPVAKMQAYHILIDRVLTLLVGLLSIAVVIAFVGVTNALMLSVVERRDELATLRALGMSRRQVRLMLAIEGLVLAGVGVSVGVLGGIPLGLLGSYTVLSRTRVFVPDVPWDMVGITMAAALAAGVCAAVLAASLPFGKQARQSS
ncbi:FtsX-like permease family protein [Buchananella felis]|uniref:FtsX-like permease family protein n=1 Tax=Buchananella felis TaxID=3231492 RepID=UPI0035284079